MNSAHDPSSCRGRTRSSASSAITASPHIRVGFDASLIRSFSPLNGISLTRGPRYARISICIGEALARARAFYVVPPSVPLANRAPSHPSLRRTSNTPSHSSSLLLLPHAHTSPCLSPGRRQHLIAGTIQGFCYLPSHTRIARLKYAASSVYVS